MTGQPPQARILVVEDEDVMRQVLVVALRSEGYLVRQAETAQNALRELRREPPDVIVLDLGLPDMDGVQLTEVIRRYHQLPIVVVSARDEEAKQVQALDAGADDYVTKPFRERELMARLRVALRRGACVEETTAVTFGDMKLDAVQRSVLIRGRVRQLTVTEFKLLWALAMAGGRVVTHGRLLREARGQNHLRDVSYLRLYMKQLRQKIEAEPSRPTRLLTALGVGYRLVLSLPDEDIGGSDC